MDPKPQPPIVPEPPKQDILPDGAKDEQPIETGFKEYDGLLGPLDDINFHRMADTLGIDYEARKIPHVQEKIAFLSDWAKQETKSDDRLTQLLAIKDLAKRLGMPPGMMNKDIVTKLHRWVYLDMQRKRIELQQTLLK
jgi:hypothetical protein